MPENFKILGYIPLGTVTKNEFRSILKAFYFSKVILLGYKKVGRGAHYDSYIDYPWWKEVIEFEYRFQTFGIDFVLAEQYPDARYEIFLEQEGSFTAYFDAVTCSYGKNSFSPLTPLDSPRDFFRVYRQENGFY